MKRITALIATTLLLTAPAFAGNPETLMAVGMPFSTASTVDALYGTALSASMLPATTNTIDLGSTSKTFRTLYTGTSRIALTSDILRVRQDAQRLFTWDGSSDTALTQTWGDGGTTAAQLFSITASTADADDDSVLNLTGGGAVGATRGAYVTLFGNEATSSGNANIGAGAGGDIQFIGQDDTLFYTAGSTLLWTMNDAGEIIGGGTATIGWTLVSAANQACTTTCVTPCVMGQETTSKAFLACSDATADICLCAGAT